MNPGLNSCKVDVWHISSLATGIFVHSATFLHLDNRDMFPFSGCADFKSLSLVILHVKATHISMPLNFPNEMSHEWSNSKADVSTPNNEKILTFLAPVQS